MRCWLSAVAWLVALETLCDPRTCTNVSYTSIQMNKLIKFNLLPRYEPLIGLLISDSLSCVSVYETTPISSIVQKYPL